jgi:hypothetical protein
MFSLSEKYRLELHWDKVLRPKAGTIIFSGAYFSGPVLAQAAQINNKDFIMLDFCSQLAVIVKNTYVVKFSWERVSYLNNIVGLGTAIMEFDPDIKGIPNLEDTDYLVIDTKDHEHTKHAFHTLYPAYVVKKDNDLYDYRRK